MTKDTGWTFGRGLLGPLRPLIGAWRASTFSPLGKVVCERTFLPTLGGKYVELRARWILPKATYEEIALFGAGADKRLAFWSFTSDGKHSTGTLSVAPEVHAKAICFAAQMPAGLARFVYWPEAGGGFCFAVEAKTKKGWSRFTDHHYQTIVSKRR